MLLIRRGLQIIFGFVLAAVLYSWWKSPNPNLEAAIGLSSTSLLIILILGPWWPSQENVDRLTQKSKLRLPTDNPQVAIYVFNFLCAAYSIYKAWDVYSNPVKELWQFEKTAFAIAGINGVIAFWLILAFGCLSHGASTYAKAKKA